MEVVEGTDPSRKSRRAREAEEEQTMVVFIDEYADAGGSHSGSAKSFCIPETRFHSLYTTGTFHA